MRLTSRPVQHCRPAPGFFWRSSADANAALPAQAADPEGEVYPLGQEIGHAVARPDLDLQSRVKPGECGNDRRAWCAGVGVRSARCEHGRAVILLLKRVTIGSVWQTLPA